MLACDIPLCLSGKVKVKTVKVECVSQHVVYQFVVGVYMQAMTLCVGDMRFLLSFCKHLPPRNFSNSRYELVSDGKSNTNIILDKQIVSFF